MQVQKESNTNRKYHRIELPAKVNIDGRVYDVKDWSLGGFMLLDTGGAFDKGWEGAVKLLLPFSQVEIALDAEARVMWASPSQAGFSFTDISNRAKNILKTYFQASIEGNLDEMDGVLAQVNAPEIGLPTETPYTSEEEKKFKRRFYGKSYFYLALGICAIVVVLTLLYYSATVAKSLSGMIMVSQVGIDSPLTGKLDKVYVMPGETVKAGQLLAGLDDKEILLKIATQRKTIQAAEAKLGEQKAILQVGKEKMSRSNKLDTELVDLEVLNYRTAAEAAVVEKEKAVLEELLNQLETTKLLSPCEAKVYICRQMDGSSVQHGQELFVLQPKQKCETSVVAKFTFTDAEGIIPGMEAEVYLPFLGKRVMGVVDAIGFQALSGSTPTSTGVEISLAEIPVRIILNDQSLELPHAATVTVNIRKPLSVRYGGIL